MNKAFDVKLCVGWLARDLLCLHGEHSDLLQTTALCLAKFGTYSVEPCRSGYCAHYNMSDTFVAVVSMFVRCSVSTALNKRFVSTMDLASFFLTDAEAHCLIEAVTCVS